MFESITEDRNKKTRQRGWRVFAVFRASRTVALTGPRFPSATARNASSSRKLPAPSSQIILQIAAAAWVAQAAQRLTFDLANALAGQTKLLPDLFQGVALPIGESKAHT